MFAESGTWDNLTWDFTNGTLIISGVGAMPEPEGGIFYPWTNFLSSIISVIIEDGITSIGDYAFSDCSGLTSVTIPNSVACIGEGAFYGCTDLTSAEAPAVFSDEDFGIRNKFVRTRQMNDLEKRRHPFVSFPGHK